MRLPTSIARPLCSAALAVLFVLSTPCANAVTSSRAVDYTDIWYAVGEDGWGVNLVQSDTFIYGTFFIFGADKKPTWITATLVWDGTSKYVGPIYTYFGSYYAGPWNSTDHVESQVGTASFTPDTNNSTLGALAYAVSGVGTVTKSLQRLTLTSIPIAGTYIGGQTGAYTGCTNSGDNSFYTDTFTLQTSQSANIASLNFSYNGLNESCTLAGALNQNGSLHSIPTATYKCDKGLNTGVAIRDIKITAQGIEGSLSAPDVGGGCREDARFSAVLY
ncbi:MAG: hypothetical protein ABI607_06825 [Betaproteobacteria bacterium]